VDGTPVVLPYYNASNPTVAYSGPGGLGTAQNTVRADAINLQAKAGVASSTPVAPAVDSGFVPLYYVTVAYGQTSVVNANISIATGAPFIPASLSGMAALSQFANSLGNSGYQKLPGGLIVQWGTAPGTFTAGVDNTITFPIAFPAAVFMVHGVNGDVAAQAGAVVGINYTSPNLPTLTGFKWRTNTTGTNRLNWISFGN